MPDPRRPEARHLTSSPVENRQALLIIQPKRCRGTAASVEQRQDDAGGIGCQGGLSLSLLVDQFDSLRLDYARPFRSEGHQGRHGKDHRESGQRPEKALPTLDSGDPRE